MVNLMSHIPSVDQVACILTKAICSSRFSNLWSKFKVLYLPTMSFGGGMGGGGLGVWDVRQGMYSS